MSKVLSSLYQQMKTVVLAYSSDLQQHQSKTTLIFNQSSFLSIPPSIQPLSIKQQNNKQSNPSVNKFPNNDPTTSPTTNTQKTGSTTEPITGGYCLLYQEKQRMKYIIIIHSTQMKRVRKIVRVPPMLKNLCLKDVKIQAECQQLWRQFLLVSTAEFGLFRFISLCRVMKKRLNDPKHDDKHEWISPSASSSLPSLVLNTEYNNINNHQMGISIPSKAADPI